MIDKLIEAIKNRQSDEALQILAKIAVYRHKSDENHLASVFAPG